MITYIIPYFATLVFFLIIDMIWLGGIAKKIYGRALGSLMTRNVRWGAAGVFYVLYPRRRYFCHSARYSRGKPNHGADPRCALRFLLLHDV